jgi:hypothetical protein
MKHQRKFIDLFRGELLQHNWNNKWKVSTQRLQNTVIFTGFSAAIMTTEAVVMIFTYVFHKRTVLNDFELALFLFMFDILIWFTSGTRLLYLVNSV